MMTFVVVLVIVCVVAAAVVFEHRIKTARFNERFPPLDDQAFLRRCGPNVRPDVALRVRRIISEQLGVEHERIYPEQSFVKDLDCC